MSLPPLAAEVLDFWFPPGVSGERRQWFQKDPSFDREIRERFGVALAAGLAGAFGDWCTSPRGALARIVLLDQYTRNAFRDTPAAFAGDPAALATAEDAIARGFDGELGSRERGFMYMPFEHSESLPVQERSVALFGALASETGVDGLLPWAERHRDIVQRFGRFPHRNEILGRESTPEEIEFLKEQGSRF
ncbi:MAG: DUF924 family protein [Casimicrobiaceae bacterium]